jgi:hypothetical protein
MGLTTIFSYRNPLLAIKKYERMALKQKDIFIFD